MNPIKTSEFVEHDKSVIQSLIDQLHSLTSVYTKLTNDLEKNKKTAIDLQKVIKLLSSARKQDSDEIEHTIVQSNKLASKNKQLKDVYSQVNREITKTTEELKKHKRHLRTTVKNVNAAEGSYNKLSSQYALNKIRLNALNIEQIKATKSGRALLAQTRMLHERMDRFQKTTGRHVHSIGNYAIATRKLRVAIMSLGGAYLGLAGAERLIRTFHDTTLELDSMDFAMKKIITTQKELGETELFLNDISKRFGLDLVKTTNSFIKFRASVGSSNLTAKQGRDIFESVSKASASLGLSTQKTERAFLALEQMISKGNVSSEELRQQLGEALPGAFNIMAQSMGVSNAKLQDLLKQGKVAAVDVLPKFAKQIEKAYNIESVRNIDNMAAAQKRATNALTEFIKSKNMQQFFTNFYKGLQFGIELIAKWWKTLVLGVKVLGSLTAAYVAYNIVLATSNLLTTSSIALAIREAVAKKGLNTVTKLLAASQAALNNVLKLNPYGLVAFALAGLVSWLILTTKKVDLLKDSFSEASKRTTEIATKLNKDLDKVLSRTLTKETTKEGLIALNKIIKEINGEKGKYIDLLKEEDLQSGKVNNVVNQLRQIRDVQAEITAIDEQSVKFQDKLQDLLKENGSIHKEHSFTKSGNLIITEIELDKTDEINEVTKILLELEDKRNSAITKRKIKLSTFRDDANINITPDGVKLDTDPFEQWQLEIEATTNKHVRNLSNIYFEYYKAKNDETNKSGELDFVLTKIFNQKIRKENDRHNKELLEQAFIDRQKEIDLMESGLDKELAVLKLRFDKMKQTHKNEARLLEAFKREEEKIIKRHNDRISRDTDKMFQREHNLRKDILKLTARDSEDLRKKELALEIEFQKKKLAAAIFFGGKLTDISLRELTARIAIMQSELDGISNSSGDRDIFSMLGFKFDDKTKRAVMEGLSITLGFIQEAIQSTVDSYDVALEKAKEQTDDTEDNLERQRDLKDKGLANDFESAKKANEQAKALEKKALENKREAVKNQLLINTALEASNLVVAISELFKLNPILGAVLAPVMVGSFLAAKSLAFSAASESFGEGGQGDIQGGSHASGNDVTFGKNSRGGRMKAEGGEKWAIFNKKQSSRYRHEITSVVNGINKGTFFNKNEGSQETDSMMPMSAGNTFAGVGNRLVEVTPEGDIVNITDLS